MVKHKTEKSHFDIANKIYAQKKDTQTEVYRIFRVYHPVYEISVDIETQLIEPSYHIIEKYMDKLVCGYLGGNKCLGDGIFVKSKDELMALLGIDSQAYEIAERFYEDLLADGHFEEVPGVGIRGLKSAKDSIKLEKRVNSATVKERKLFDQFSAKLMPSQFYEFSKYACQRESLNEDSPLVKNSVWLEPDLSIVNTNVDIEQMLGNFSYINTEQIDRGLPQGYQNMHIAKGEPVEMAFYPYYLAILKKGKEFYYEAYRIDNGNPIAWIGEQYRTGYYKAAVERLLSLAEISEPKVTNPLDRNFSIIEDGVLAAGDGITKDKNTGNYIWTLQDFQIKDLIGLGEDRTFKRSSCFKIAQKDVCCLASYEAGKLVIIKKTEEQKQLLLACAEAEEAGRAKLFEQYLKK